VKHGFVCGSIIGFLACAQPRPQPPRGNLIEAIAVIDRSCRVYPADTLTLAAAHDRYGPTCHPVLDHNTAPQYQSKRPTGSYGRVTLVIYGVDDRSPGAMIQAEENGTIFHGRRLSRPESGAEFAFDSVPGGAYVLTAKAGGKSYTVGYFRVRLGELWEFFFVPPAGR
jgi:hypothetical protein